MRPCAKLRERTRKVRDLGANVHDACVAPRRVHRRTERADRQGGIAWAQRSRGLPWQKGYPAIASVMTGIRRTTGTAPTRKAAVIDLELAKLVATLDGGLRGLRDRRS